MKFTTSNPKVEKVVKPPHNPMIQKARKRVSPEFCSQCFTQMPIRKAPRIFTTTIGQGIQKREKCPNKTRNTDPIAPPPATSRRNFQSMILPFLIKTVYSAVSEASAVSSSSNSSLESSSSSKSSISSIELYLRTL